MVRSRPRGASRELGAAALGAWPIQARPPSRGSVAALVGGAIAVALGITLVPATGQAGSIDLACGALTCGVRGMLAAFPAWLAARAVRRDAVGSALGAATLAGTSAFFALRASCGDDSIAHGLVAHVVPIVVTVALATLVTRWLARRRWHPPTDPTGAR